MSNGIDGVTTAALSAALDAATLRHQVISNNVANASTEGYVPRRVSFEAYLRSAAGHGAGGFELEARVEPSLTASGQPQVMSLDTEVAALAQNNLHYQALVKALNRHMSILSSAASDGKR